MVPTHCRTVLTSKPISALWVVVRGRLDVNVVVGVDLPKTPAFHTLSITHTLKVETIVTLTRDKVMSFGGHNF